jgi:hypothetical protein
MVFFLDLKKPSGVVLEAPFYNTLQGLVSYPLTRVNLIDLISKKFLSICKVLKINPYFMQAALDALTIVKLDFPNNEM